MAKQKKKQLNAWDRFWLWVKRNEKVLFVLLLALLGFSFAFGTQVYSTLGNVGDSIPIGFGKTIGGDEFRARQEILNRTAGLAREYLFFDGLPQTVVAVFDGGGSATVNMRRFLLYEEAAKRLGLKVSDAELQAERRRLWRVHKAAEHAAQNLAARGVSASQGGLYRYQHYLEMVPVLTALEKEDYFRPEEYTALVKTGTRGLKVSHFEEGIRDYLLLGRLADYLASSVQVTAREVYERFRNEEHERRLRWVGVEAPGELVETIRGALLAEEGASELQAFYGLHRQEKYSKDTTTRFRWLKVDAGHFASEVERELSDATLEEAYRSERDRYRRPGIRRDTGLFELRSPEEKSAWEAEVYLPFEDVRDEVRERYVRREARRRLSDFARKASLQLKARDSIGETGNPRIEAPEVTFESLASEHEFVTTGSAGFFERSEAEEVLGELYGGSVKTAIDGWFATAVQPEYQLNERQRNQLEHPLFIDDEVGDGERSARCAVLLADVELRAPGIPELEEIREEVAGDLAREKAVELLAAALEPHQKKVSAGETALDELAGVEVEVERDGRKFLATLSALEEPASLYVKKTGQVMVPAPESSEEDPASDDRSDGPEEPDEVPHPSSQALRASVFGLEKEGEVTLARDAAEGAVFLVEYVVRKDPDPARFADARRRYEIDLYRERVTAFFANWERAVAREALGEEIPAG